MEDDDEFGDLYTNVIQPFAPSSPSPPKTQPIIHLQQIQSPQQHAQPSLVHSVDTDVKFDIEDDQIDDAPLIPGLSATAEEPSRTIDEAAGDWGESDDDSDDDLQIVLDDSTAVAPAPPADDGGLDIAGDAEEHDWGENSTQPVDGENKDVGESVKSIAPKIGYSNHGYHHHPFHSQFKVSSLVNCNCIVELHVASK